MVSPSRHLVSQLCPHVGLGGFFWLLLFIAINCDSCSCRHCWRKRIVERKTKMMNQSQSANIFQWSKSRRRKETATQTINNSHSTYDMNQTRKHCRRFSEYSFYIAPKYFHLRSIMNTACWTVTRIWLKTWAEIFTVIAFHWRIAIERYDYFVAAVFFPCCGLICSEEIGIYT